MILLTFSWRSLTEFLGVFLIPSFVSWVTMFHGRTLLKTSGSSRAKPVCIKTWTATHQSTKPDWLHRTTVQFAIQVQWVFPMDCYWNSMGILQYVKNVVHDYYLKLLIWLLLSVKLLQDCKGSNNRNFCNKLVTQDFSSWFQLAVSNNNSFRMLLLHTTVTSKFSLPTSIWLILTGTIFADNNNC